MKQETFILKYYLYEKEMVKNIFVNYLCFIVKWNR